MVVTAGARAAAAIAPETNLHSALRDIHAAQDDLDELATSLSARMSELHALQDKFETAVSKHAKSIRALASNHPEVATASTLDSPAASAASDVQLSHERLKQMQLLMPSTGGMFVELFLGCLNVKFVRKSERLAFKQGYERLKLKLAPVFVVFCIICLVFEEYRWIHMILQLALTSYYVALAVRENILRTNGSNIRAWWIIHHYFTMMQGVLLLTWPNGVSYARFRRPLHLFGLYNAVLMIFQTRYQMARLYTLRSLGRANEMDVASSDSTQIHWSETMRLLLPLIVLGQMMQAYQAMTLFAIYKEFPTELQILLLAILFTANFIGNSTTTMQVLIAKHVASKRTSTSRPSPSPPNGIYAASAQDRAGPSQTLTREEEKKSS